MDIPSDEDRRLLEDLGRIFELMDKVGVVRVERKPDRGGFVVDAKGSRVRAVTERYEEYLLEAGRRARETRWEYLLEVGRRARETR